MPLQTVRIPASAIACRYQTQTACIASAASIPYACISANSESGRWKL